MRTGASMFFQRPLALIFEYKIESISDMVADGSRNRNPTWFGNPFQPGSHVHTVPENVITINDHIADIDADAILDPALLRPGRFDRRIVVNRPDVKGREGILAVHTRKIPMSDDVDVAVLARGSA